MTPRAATPDDFTQWRRWVERQLRNIAAAASYRPGLRVDVGDFNVSGGGNIIVGDGGGIQVEDGGKIQWWDANGYERFYFGNYVDSGGDTLSVLTYYDNDGDARIHFGELDYDQLVGHGLAVFANNGQALFGASEESFGVWDPYSGSTKLFLTPGGDDQLSLYTTAGNFAGGLWRTENSGYQLDVREWDGSGVFQANSDQLLYFGRGDNEKIWASSAGNVKLQATAGKTLDLSSAGNGDVWIDGGGRVDIQAGTRIHLWHNALEIHNLQNASASANLFINGADRVWRSTSSRRYKQDIAEAAPLDVDKVLALKPHTWRDITDVDENGDNAEWYTGYIAEDIHDAGLTDFVRYIETDDGQRVPDGIEYDKLGAVSIHALAEHHRQRAEDAESRLDSLAARVEALEARLNAIEG